MIFNLCKTCKAKNGRAGVLIDGECRNCHCTRKTNNIHVFTELIRTKAELLRTFAIIK